MTIEDFETYVRERVGLAVETVEGSTDQLPYTVIRGILITKGALSGTTCDVAIRREQATPFIVPAAIHTRPALVTVGTLSTQESPIGPEWQYWSRRFEHPVTPANLWLHVLTILGEVA
jgi:hypothetical protein